MTPIISESMYLPVPEYLVVDNTTTLHFSELDFNGLAYVNEKNLIYFGLNGKDEYVELNGLETVTEVGDPCPTVKEPFVIRYKNALIQSFDLDGDTYYYRGKLIGKSTPKRSSSKAWTYYFSTYNDDFNVISFNHRNPTEEDFLKESFTNVETYGDVLLYYSPYQHIDSDYDIITVCSPEIILTEPITNPEAD